MSSLQGVIDTCRAANAASLATGHVTNIFNQGYKQAFKVRTDLKHSYLKYLQDHTDFPFVYTPEKAITHDHSLLYAMRELTREAFEDSFHVSTAENRTLIVGSSAREIRKYSSNPSIHYYIHGKENKDYDRVIGPALNDILKELKKKAAKTNRKVFMDKNPDPNTPRPVLKRYEDAKQIYTDWCKIKKMPATIHTEPIEAETLVLEDSFYNLGPEDWIDLFDKTKANIAYGYGMLPWELIFPDKPSNPYYTFRTFSKQVMSYDFNGKHYFEEMKVNAETLEAGIWEKIFDNCATNLRKYAVLTFRNGYSNGYVHDLEKWMTLLRSPVIRSKDPKKTTQLAIEITSRVGPMAIFKVYRAKHAETIVRTLALPEQDEFVKLLDLYASVDHGNCKLNSPLRYFTARSCDVWDALNYAYTLPEASCTFKNVLVFCRKRMGGVSLINKELQPGWELDPQDLHKFALAIYLQAITMDYKTGKAVEKAKVTSILEKFKRMIKSGLRYMFLPIALLIDLIFAENLTDKIIVHPPHACSRFQYDDVYANYVQKQFVDANGNPKPPGTPGSSFMGPSESYGMYCDANNEEEKPLCPDCDFFAQEIDMPDGTRSKRSGLQIFECGYKTISEHTFRLSDKEVSEVLNKLMDDDNDPYGLKNIKERAKQAFPKTGFEHTVRVEYYRGGPGTGKSETIKSMATNQDIILAPFSKLKKDYMGVKDADGFKIDLPFATQHRGVAVVGCEVMYVDEFTSYPYEFLAAAVFNTRPKKVVLCGDERQTKTKEPDEGIYVGSRIPLKDLSTHELLVNFRNPPDVVALLNRKYGYKMFTYKTLAEKERGIDFITQAQLKAKPDLIPNNALRMAFSTAGAKQYVENEKCTVRSNQGQTYEKSVLYLSKLDTTLPKVSELAIVALSRHKEKLYVVHDNSQDALSFINELQMDQDFYTNLTTWIPIPLKHVKEITRDPEEVVAVIPSDDPITKAPSDSYLMIKEDLPVVATDTEVPALNELTGYLVRDDFTTARTNETELYVKQNIRGHPVRMEDQWYCMGPGLGKHYQANRAFQVLRVIGDRYDGSQPRRVFDEAAKAYAKKVADFYYDKYYIDKVAEFAAHADGFWDDLMIDTVAQKFVSDAKKRNYKGRYQGEGGSDNPDAAAVKFMLKTIFKPDNTFKEMDLYKAGQGISSWSPAATTQFALAFRLLDRIRLSLMKQTGNTTMHTDHYVTEEDFMTDIIEAVNQKAKTFGYEALFIASTDLVEADKNQNEFTQWIERWFYKRLGVSDMFLDAYYRFRNNYRVYSSLTASKAKSAQTSGSPGTLLNTEIVVGATTTWVLCHDGPVTFGSKGDDTATIGYNLKVDEQKLKELYDFYPAKLRVQIGKESEFCGMTLTPTGLRPNLYRKLVKISGMRWKNYAHFCEYQKSLRDYIDLVTRIGNTKCEENTAKVNRKDMNWAEQVRWCIDSWSHINEKQWLSQVSLVRAEMSLPQYDPDSDIHVSVY